VCVCVCVVCCVLCVCVYVCGGGPERRYASQGQYNDPGLQSALDDIVRAINGAEACCQALFPFSRSHLPTHTHTHTHTYTCTHNKTGISRRPIGHHAVYGRHRGAVVVGRGPCGVRLPHWPRLYSLASPQLRNGVVVLVATNTVNPRPREIEREERERDESSERLATRRGQYLSSSSRRLQRRRDDSVFVVVRSGGVFGQHHRQRFPNAPAGNEMETSPWQRCRARTAWFQQ
jgi:hypothetical protein